MMAMAFHLQRGGPNGAVEQEDGPSGISGLRVLGEGVWRFPRGHEFTYVIKNVA